MDKLDQIHVVSDLHLGGALGHQIFKEGPALAAVIDHLATAPARRVGLVLNGDIVDFLAADDAKHFDPVGAPRKLQAIFDAPAFAPVWQALARFTRAEGRVLVLVIGNHDVELALPEVQALLLSHLCGSDAAARGRVRIAMDGTGYSCLVGGRRVLVIHGNDADPWNIVDHDGIREYVRAENGGAARRMPATNAGTRLVVDVMNGVKRSFPFVDLLKPETVPVPGVLLALPVDLHPPLLDFAKITLRLAYDKARADTGFLGDAPPPPEDGYRALDILLRGAAPRVASEDVERLLDRAQADFAAGRRPTDVLGQDDAEMLGVGGLIWDRISGRDPRDNLREALAKYLATDRTFAFDEEDDLFREHDALVGPDVPFIVTGHTHLERRIRRKRAMGVYFNSGTWIRLIQLRPEMLASREAFAPVYKALSEGAISDLDDTPGLVIARRTVVSIWVDDASVRGELRHALSPEQATTVAPAPPWEPVADTLFSIPSVENA